MFDLLGERYQAGLSYLELGRLAATAGRDRARHATWETRWPFSSRSARSPISHETRAAIAAIPAAATGAFLGAHVEGDAALVRRIVDAAVTPALLAKEGTTALLEACDAQAAVIFTSPRAREVHVIAAVGCDADTARALAGAAARSLGRPATPLLIVEPIGRDGGAPSLAAVSGTRPFAPPVLQRARTLCAVLRQGFELCAARERPVEAAPGRSSARSSRCCRDSSAPAPRCSASSIRSSGCRATI